MAITTSSLQTSSKSVSRQPARHCRGGFCLCGVAVALEAARAPSGRGAQRGGGEARAGPAAAERGTPGLRSPLAPGSGCLPGAAPAVRRLPGPGPRGAGDGGRPCGAASRRPEAVLGREQLGAGVQALSRRARPRARAAGADPSSPGGRSFVTGKAERGPAGPSRVYAREIQQGGIRPHFWRNR